MNKVQEAWKKMRMDYQRRYAKYCKQYKDSGETDKECLGHLLECSFVLIGVFGLTSKQVDEVERFNGFTKEDLD